MNISERNLNLSDPARIGFLGTSIPLHYLDCPIVVSTPDQGGKRNVDAEGHPPKSNLAVRKSLSYQIPSGSWCITSLLANLSKIV